ncbi:penicillin binding protein transpeptidase domain-containing protein [Staphylococcus aureus]|nr:penicillin binding protein transpeptidase domain-containing protein [Staphylococcus aureus]
MIRKAEAIQSPITFWYGKYIILIPSSYFKSVIDKRLKYIILHEYAHAKNRDTLHLIIFNIFSIVMSYNPLIHIVKRKIIHDNEVEADRFVLNNINKNEFKTYAESIMDSVLNIPFFNKNILSHSFNGKKSLLKRRLINIKEANLKKQSKLIPIFICIFTFLLIVIQSQFLMGQSITDYNYKKPLQNDHQILDESKNFGSNSGSFVMYSMKKDKYYIYNEKESRKRYSPDSTYKIYLAMFGLDRHIISDKNSRMSWNHKHYPFESWNKEQDLNTAMQNSVNWYFERISNQIPKNYTAAQLKQLNYGNENLGSYKNYWMEDSLKISNLEQVIVFKNMMEQNNHFSKKAKNQLSSSLLIKKNEKYELYGKTGTGIVNGKYNNGWFVGYVITNHDKYYFATHLSDGNPSGKNAEWDVMNIIWDKKSVSANEIVVEIQKYKEVSDKTIRTLITRLYKKEIIKRYKSENIYFYSSNIKEDDIKMKTAKTFLNKLYGGDMKSLVLNFAKNEELNNKEIEELRDILNDISKK